MSRAERIANVPIVMRNARRWIHWFRDPERGKIPLAVHYRRGGPSYTTPEVWVGFDEAVKRLRRGRGLGFMLGGGFAGVDIDDCVEQGRLSEEARELLDQLNTYSEISPSGTGVKAFLSIKDPWLGSHADKAGGLEMYVAGRFFTVTGRRLTDWPAEVRDGTDAYRSIAESRFGTAGRRSTKSAKRYAYDGFDLEAWIATHLPNATRREHPDRVVWTFACPWHPQPRPDGHGDAASVTRYADGNIVAGCFGARCQTGFGPEGAHRWMLVDLVVKLDEAEHETTINVCRRNVTFWEGRIGKIEVEL